nr:transmembrane protein 232 [Pogona vitticeps]XP_020635655.1 transmembrane protein 232 [Pogona vitticeps]XP_020635656.1 transmembrane protein 232 [Pogona vitticeps]XP_020635657.1 transmembrane protein 232 [Pogona vitticeps]XP_020635658.1 transmembrane protein 232 [Pogona vitticeps]
MPIIKVPVVRKFGIVSHDEHQKIQQRLLARYLKENNFKSKKQKPKNPLELTEEFIEDFNESLKTEKEETFIELAEKMLARCKRRSGLSTLGCGKYVDLPLAWTEAIMLAQCKGNISEEALEILIISLDHAPVEADHIPVLFFLAESILYKLCHDVVQKQFLFSCEIKLYKLGFLVLLRLLLLHFFGGQNFSAESKSRLHIGLKAVAACETCYQIYPNILFMVHFILKAGETICETVVLSDSSLATQADLEERQDKAFIGTSLMSTGTAAELNTEQKQFKIKPFLWHSLLVWVCVHNSCSEIDEVLRHVLFYKEQLHEKNWLESILSLMVLGETAKLNMSCLNVLMDLVRDFIASSVPLPKQEKNSKENISCWCWEIVYIYTNILREICLHSINADLQKTAFLGFCACVAELKDDKELKGASFLDLLCYYPLSNDCDDPFWMIRYGVIYNLVILHRQLSRDANREGLRNAVWRALQKQKEIEKDTRVLNASKVAEVEAQGPTDPFLVSKDKSLLSPRDFHSTQYIGWRVATSMCHHFLPPIIPDIPLPRHPVQKKAPLMPHEESVLTLKEKKTKRLSLREELLQAGVPKYPYPDYFTRTDMELRKIVETQWEKELQLRLKLEEKLLELELQEKQKLEEEHFKQIMSWRLEKLHKTTKPYELPFQHEEEQSKVSSSTQVYSPQLSQS